MLGILAITVALPSFAFPEMYIFESPVIWRADDQGDYVFKGNGKLQGAKLADDGAVEYAASPGTYELANPYNTEDLVLSVTLNWVFTGKVTMEFSPTGNTNDYIPLTNGVPVELKSGYGSKLKWKATLYPDSRLTEVRLSYKDIKGVVGGFGNPKLSGFGFRKAIVIASPATEGGVAKQSLFNHQIPIKIAESEKVEGADVYIKGIIFSNFMDVRFTQADGETLLSHYLESVSGNSPERVATCWVKAPQIPGEGLPIYLYYGKLAAQDLSDGEETFEFFYDFKDSEFDSAKWESYGFKEGVLEYSLKTGGKIETLDMAAITREAMIQFFKDGNDFKWARVRKGPVEVKKTAGAAEEVPNAADFQGVEVAPNGDLVLSGSEGAYTSPFIHSSFNARIIVPSWKAIIPENTKLAINISAKANSPFRQDCVNENYYYASKADFEAGKSLRWQAALRAAERGETIPGPRLKRLTFDFRPGMITLISPDGGEKLVQGASHAITWSAFEYEPSYPLQIDYSLDGGKTYFTIAEAVSNIGNYLWKVPKAPSSKALVKVSDAFDNQIYDASNKAFSIMTAEEYRKHKVKKGKIAIEEAAEEGIAEEAAEGGIAEEGAEEKTGEEEVTTEEELSQEKPGTQLYELLIKLGDNVLEDNPEEDERGSYKEGDIVVIKPAGHQWSDTERNSFLIARAYLTKKEALELTQPKVAIRVDDSGKTVTEIVRIRKFKMDLKKVGLKDEKSTLKEDLLKTKPLVGKAYFEEKK